jgi:hypothetical protein
VTRLAAGGVAALLAAQLLAAAPAETAADVAPVTLEFRDFYRQPVGRYGLEPTARLLSLNGQRVRIVGYMVDSEQPVAGVFMLTPLPVQLAESDDGPADDLPGSAVFVHLPGEYASRLPKFQRGEWEITGRLELGPREEANGRISYIRVLADPPAAPGPAGAAGSRLATPTPTSTQEKETRR